LETMLRADTLLLTSRKQVRFRMFKNRKQKKNCRVDMCPDWILFKPKVLSITRWKLLYKRLVVGSGSLKSNEVVQQPDQATIPKPSGLVCRMDS
jgi:hypothetical protein